MAIWILLPLWLCANFYNLFGNNHYFCNSVFMLYGSKITRLIFKMIQKYFFPSLYIHPYKTSFSAIHIAAHTVYISEGKKAKNNKHREMWRVSQYITSWNLLPHTGSLIDLYSPLLYHVSCPIKTYKSRSWNIKCKTLISVKM